MSNLDKDRDMCACGGIILADTENWKTPLCDECYSDIERLYRENAKLRECLNDMINSKALQEAPSYSYSEAVLRARQYLDDIGESND